MSPHTSVCAARARTSSRALPPLTRLKKRESTMTETLVRSWAPTPEVAAALAPGLACTCPSAESNTMA
eukprot:scaffold16728_cov137-Isochrysis_galbana.AAC.6